MRDDNWLTFALIVLPLSFLSIGGGAAILAPLHDTTVNQHGWLTQNEFVDVFAISRASPGPGSLMVAVIGYKVGGWLGAIAATIAIFLPSSVLYYLVAKVWNKYRGTRLHTALEAGLAPVGLGLALAGAIAILRAAEAGVMGWILAGVSTTLLSTRRDIQPLLILGGAGAFYACYRLLVG